MDILEYLRSKGIEPKKKTADEYCSPCPVCGGKDRFTIWPHKDRWHCRGCDCSDTLVGLVMRVERMEFPEACALIGKPLEPMQKRSRSTKAYSPPKRYEDSLHVAAVAGGELWKQKAPQFIDYAHDCLLKNNDVLEWLQSARRLSLKTISKFRIGWNPQEIFIQSSEWGVVAEEKMRFPRGLVIPYYRAGEIVKIKIRIPKNSDRLPARLKPARPPHAPYHEVRGGSQEFLFCGDNLRNFIVVESELDAIFLWQEVGDYVTAVAMGGAKKPPDRASFTLLRNAERVFVTLDSDESGEAGAEKLENLLTNSRPFPIPLLYGKDPTEAAVRHGVDIRRQVLRALGIPVAAPQTTVSPDGGSPNTPPAGQRGEALADDNSLVFQAVELEALASAAGMIEVAYQLDRALGTFDQTGEIAVDRDFARSVLRSAIDNARRMLELREKNSPSGVAA